MPRPLKIPRPVPLFLVCARIQCETIIREVQTIDEQQQRTFCSERCQSLDRRSFQEAWRKGGTISGAKRTAKLLAEVRGLDPLAAYRLGYQRGRDRDWQQEKRRRQGHD